MRLKFALRIRLRMLNVYMNLFWTIPLGVYLPFESHSRPEGLTDDLNVIYIAHTLGKDGAKRAWVGP